METIPRRRYRSALLGCIAVLSCNPAGAQDIVVNLPDVNVSATRLITREPRAPARERAPRVTPAPTPATVAAPPSSQPTPPQPTESASGVLTGTLITGASSTVITSADIARSPGQTLQDILSREPGVQVTNLFGGVNGARSTVDLRGFGATAANNTLVLINGRRINDLDIEAVDLSTIPRESIERVEITRGNSGAVLYGEGAVGGVINIVTKTGAGVPTSARVAGTFGSFNYAEGVASANGSWNGKGGSVAASVLANEVSSDGYRRNNRLNQRNAVGDIRFAGDLGSAYINLSASDQHLGLPGARLVQASTGINQLISDPTGAATPFDFADTQRAGVTAGFTRMLVPGAELIVDGGFRQKKQQAAFFGSFFDPAGPDPKSFFAATLGTTSVTPRVKIDIGIAGVPVRALGGIDYYRTTYESPRSVSMAAPPIHQYNLSQTSLAAYWQQTAALTPKTDLAAGFRWQRTSVTARDRLDINAPGAFPVQCFPPFGCFGDTEGIPLDKSEDNQAYHIGLEHRFNESFTIFGRHARSFRVPNVDERVGMVTAQNGVPSTFDLRTQKSVDIEGGFRLRAGNLDFQWSVYDMWLVDEIAFRYAENFVVSNTNLDPTHRYGNETIASYRVSESVLLKGGLAYTRSVFREGLFAGNDVPLVSRWTGSVGVAWDIWQKHLTFDGTVRYVGARRMDNDQLNLQPLIPAHALVDVRIGGVYEKFFWSFAIQNLFNLFYFDYAIASPFPFGPGSELGKYNAYPQPGRMFMAKAGATF